MNVDIFNTQKKYQIIYADPPWNYNDKNCMGGCGKQYQTMKLDDISALPINKLADKDAVLFLWATYPKLDEALKLIQAWGFTFKSIAFQWVKLNKSTDIKTLQKFATTESTIEKALDKCCFFGLGRWTRGNTEPCLIAVKGKPRREKSNVRQLVFSPLARHSAKPPIIRNKIKELMGEKNCIELFARDRADGWDCWGDEAPKD